MRSDLDRLMAARDLQAILVAGGEQANTARRYLSNGVDIHGGMTIKKRGAEPVLIVGIMEVEEAARSGLQVYTHNDFDWPQLLKAAEGNSEQALPEYYRRILTKLEIAPGRIGVYGVGDLHVWIERIEKLRAALPEYTFVGESGMTLFDEAYITKDAEELAILREVARRTSEVLQATWDFIAGQRAEGDTVVKADGSPLTIGDVKRFVRRELLDRDLEDTDMIFAQGRDAAFPHSRGESSMALKLGQPIVFDLFPRQINGGYHHDVTRTWSIGYATPEVSEIFEQVMTAYYVALDAFAEPGQPTHLMQEAVQSYFESKGHPTARSKPGTTEGYVHGLGHGVGLNIHERPSINHLVKTDTFQVGNFITIEPGLYYPERGIGARVEDSFIISADGKLEAVTDFHKELVLPLRG